MAGFVEVADRDQASFLPACLEDYVDADNPVRIIDAFVDELDLAGLGFERVQPALSIRRGPGERSHAHLLVCRPVRSHAQSSRQSRDRAVHDAAQPLLFIGQVRRLSEEAGQR